VGVAIGSWVLDVTWLAERSALLRGCQGVPDTGCDDDGEDGHDESEDEDRGGGEGKGEEEGSARSRRRFNL
jgi:hypothetical protein